ncbi:hypothetical protein HOT31_gp035 [Microbacterium phage Hendrix]|uniref:Uncharacterized protein n=1 Tax=Microbacterium phage Hendrix TaxID=2182341 RepID=A0A2U8UUL9_9CAUD|nr:hypothetical protein HOT31_gp035 [Microbacterium phage Hendrix]AWN07706.1 hypothetical protein PBI_HENDRIX_35 [Microbacterium phage Hendrix]
MPRARSPLRGISPIRRLVYALGFRPRRHSIFFSPSLDMTAPYRGRTMSDAFLEGLRQGEQALRDQQPPQAPSQQHTNPTDAASAAHSTHSSDKEGIPPWNRRNQADPR